MKYRNNDDNSAVTCAREIAKALQIDSGFAESRPRKKRRVFEYEAEDKSYEMSQEDQLTTLFLPLIDHAIYFFTRPLLSKCIRWVQFLILIIIKTIFCESTSTIIFPGHVRIFTKLRGILTRWK